MTTHILGIIFLTLAGMTITIPTILIIRIAVKTRDWPLAAGTTFIFSIILLLVGLLLI